MSLFQIIIPNLNSGNELQQCLISIESIIGSIEMVLVIDGGSTDNSINQSKALYPKLRVYVHAISGIYEAMNYGLGIADSTYVYFLGSDDRITLDFVRVLDVISSNRNYDMLYFNVYFNDNRNVYDGEFNRNKIIVKNICHQAIIYNRNTLLAMGGYNVKYRVLADWDVNLRFFGSSELNISYFNYIICTFNTTGFSSSSELSNELHFYLSLVGRLDQFKDEDNYKNAKLAALIKCSEILAIKGYRLRAIYFALKTLPFRTNSISYLRFVLGIALGNVKK